VLSPRRISVGAATSDEKEEERRVLMLLALERVPPRSAAMEAKEAAWAPRLDWGAEGGAGSGSGVQERC